MYHLLTKSQTKYMRLMRKFFVSGSAVTMGKMFNIKLQGWNERETNLLSNCTEEDKRLGVVVLTVRRGDGTAMTTVHHRFVTDQRNEDDSGAPLFCKLSSSDKGHVQLGLFQSLTIPLNVLSKGMDEGKKQCRKAREMRFTLLTEDQKLAEAIQRYGKIDEGSLRNGFLAKHCPPNRFSRLSIRPSSSAANGPSSQFVPLPADLADPGTECQMIGFSTSEKAEDFLTEEKVFRLHLNGVAEPPTDDPFHHYRSRVYKDGHTACYDDSGAPLFCKWFSSDKGHVQLGLFHKNQHLGHGSENSTRYAIPVEDSCQRECRPFQYKGMKGNQNNFRTKASCEANCKAVQWDGGAVPGGLLVPCRSERG